MTFGWQLYYRNRPQYDIPRVPAKGRKAAITVVHMLKTVFANRPEVDIQDADI